MIRKSTIRQATATHEMARIACANCGARLTFDPTVAVRRIQCPKCLNPIELPAPAGVGTSVSPAGTIATGGGTATAAAVVAPPRPRKREVPAVVEPVAVVGPAPALAGASPGGAEAPLVAGTHGGLEEARALLVSVTAERDALKHRLGQAESMLAEAGHALDRLRELERRIDEMGTRYLLALGRVRELEGGQARGA